MKAALRLASALCFSLGFIVAALSAQDREAIPVPVWTGTGTLPPGGAGKYVFLTPDRHTAIVRLPGSGDSAGATAAIIRLPLYNDLKPLIESVVLQESAGQFSYQYSISNGKAATDSIGVFSIIAPPEDTAVAVQPPGLRACWAGAPSFSRIAKQPRFPLMPAGRFLMWVRSEGRVIRPGQCLGCFLVRSAFKPGLTTAWVAAAEFPHLVQNWPLEVLREFDFLNDRKWREKDVLVLAPMFAPDTSRAVIVATLTMQLEALKQAGAVDAESPFIRDVLQVLRRLTDDEQRVETWNAPGVTEFERNLSAILRYSLDLGVR